MSNMLQTASPSHSTNDKLNCCKQ